MALIAQGLDVSTVARLIGVPRSTVGNWRHGRAVEYHRRLGTANSRWRPLDTAQYAYLLGVYLGDGCLSIGRSRGCDPGRVTGFRVPRDRHGGRSGHGSGFPADVCAPRHAKGRQLDGGPTQPPSPPLRLPPARPRPQAHPPIELTGWQRDLTHAHPRELLRGLIHSDGCRCVNRFKTKLPSGRIAEYEYPRYFFSNLSADIRRIFCEHCELLGIRCTQSNPRNVSISHRKSVALLDEFVGPKT